MLDRLFEFLRAIFTIRKAPVEIDELFKHIDLAAIAVEIGVDSRGEEEGKANVPPADATKLGGSEGIVANYFVQEAQATAVKAQTKIVSYRSRMQQQDIGVEKGQLRVIVPNLKSHLDRILVNSKGFLPQLRRASLGCESRLAEFKSRNDIDIPASRIVVRKNLGFLSLLIVFESLLNAYFFSLGSDLGLIGGWLEALFASLINNGLAFVIGWTLLRNIFHRSAHRKIVGGAAIAIFVLVMPIVNLAIAHYREAVAVVAETAQADALRSLLESLAMMSPGIERLDSWVLWTAGMIFATSALFDGLYMDDKYPGYGKIDREFQEADSEYSEAREDLLDEVIDETSRAENRIDVLMTSLLEKQENLRTLAGMSQTIESRCEGYHRVLEQSCDALLNRYRGKNLAHRTEPAPPHFNRQYQFTRLLLELPETIKQGDVSDNVNEIEQLLGESEEIKKKIRVIYTDYRRDIDTMISNLESEQSS